MFVLKSAQFVMSDHSVNNIKVSFQAKTKNIQSELKVLCENSEYVTKKDLNFSYDERTLCT